MQKMINLVKLRIRQRSPFIANIPRPRIFEGDKWLLVRADGSRSLTSFKLIKDDFNFDISELEDIDFAKFLAKLEKLSENLGKAEAKMVFNGINKAVKEVGNVVSAKGKPFSIDFILQMLEKIEMEFNDDGTPIMPSMVMHPKTAKELNLDKIFSDLESDSKFNDLITKKREEWSEREASRRLVG